MAKGSVLANTLPANAKVWSPQKGRKQHKLTSIKAIKLLVLPLSWFPVNLKTGFAWFCKASNSSNITESLGISHTPRWKCREKIWKQIIQLINHWLLNWLFIDRIDYSSRIHWVFLGLSILIIYWISNWFPNWFGNWLSIDWLFGECFFLCSGYRSLMTMPLNVWRMPTWSWKGRWSNRKPRKRGWLETTFEPSIERMNSQKWICWEIILDVVQDGWKS